MLDYLEHAQKEGAEVWLRSQGSAAWQVTICISGRCHTHELYLTHSSTEWLIWLPHSANRKCFFLPYFLLWTYSPLWFWQGHFCLPLIRNHYWQASASLSWFRKILPLSNWAGQLQTSGWNSSCWNRKVSLYVWDEWFHSTNSISISMRTLHNPFLLGDQGYPISPRRRKDATTW